MIVEDEPPIQRSIKHTIESSNSNFKVVACAFNGESAILMLNDLVPEVIFMDICMPVVDGIALMDYLFNNFPDIIKVVISGYQKFEYTKKALQFDVFDYILKPPTIAEMKTLLERIQLKINSNKDEEFRSNLEKSINGNLKLNTRQPTHTYCAYKQYVVILICAGSYPSFSVDYLIPARGFWEKINLEAKIILPQMKEDKVFVFDGKSSAEKIVIFAVNQLLAVNIRDYSHILEGVFKDVDIPITMVVSPILNNLDEIGYISQLMRITLNKKIMIGVSQTIFENSLDVLDPSEHIQIPKLSKEDEDMLILLLKQANMKLFKSNIKKIIDSFHGQRYPQIWVEKLLKHIFSLCQYTVLHDASYSPANIELEINEAITNSLSYSDLFDNLWCVFEQLFNIHKNFANKKIYEPKLIQNIETFLLENVSEPITNTMLSEKFGFVPSYLSKLFKSYKGISPTEYLTSLRIQKAKDLIIANPQIMAKEIAEKIGYSDPHYFSRIFKKETGIWPTEYKKSCE